MNLSELVLYWNKKAAELLDFHSNPGHDSRRFAVIQIAIHDTLNCYLKKYKTYSRYPDNTINQFLGVTRSLPKGYRNSSVKQAVNRAAYKALIWAANDVVKGIPKQADFDLGKKLKDIECWYEYVKLVDATANKVGEYWVNEITIWNRDDDNIGQVKGLSEKEDGSLSGKFRADYFTLDLPLSSSRYKLLVNYSVVKPFVLTTHDQFRRPLVYTASEEAIMIDEVELLGKKQYVNMLPPKQREKIDFWSNGKHHIIWNDFATEIIESKKSSLDACDIARVFALIHTAMADGVIAMFGDLYHDDFYHWRPVTALYYKKYNSNPLQDKNAWGAYKPYDQTPRVPEYPSAFGVLGGATGAILTAIFGDAIDVAVNRTVNPVTYTLNYIHYNSISQAVHDNAYTKLNCGWHFRKSLDESLILGRKIGDYVRQHKFQRIRKPRVPEIWPSIFKERA